MSNSLLLPVVFALKNNPNAYVVIVGAGLSSASGLPRADQIVEALAHEVAVLEGAEPEDAATTWYEKQHGHSTYQAILERLAPAQGERQALISGFLAPDPKSPGARRPNVGHRALARFAASGHLRAFVTTNFDHLLEEALRDMGLSVSSVSTEDDVDNLPPVDTVDALVFHLHGDYLKPETMRNTEAELSDYEKWSHDFLAELLRGRGYLIVGWSGNYDPALRDALETAANGRYSTFWFERSRLTGEGQRLFTSLPGAVLLPGDAGEMLSAAAEGVDLLSATHGPTRDSALEVSIAKQDLLSGHRPGRALAALDRMTDDVLALPSMTAESFETGGEFGSRMRDILGASRDLCALAMVLGGNRQSEADIVDVIRFLAQPVYRGGISALLAQRQLPGILVLAAAGVGATAARSWVTVGTFLTECHVPTLSATPGDEAPLACCFSDDMFRSPHGATLLREYLATVNRDSAVMSSARYEEAWERWHLLWLHAALDYDHGNPRFRVPSLTVAGWRDTYSPMQDQWLQRVRGQKVPELAFLDRPTDFAERFRKQADEAAWSTLPPGGGALPSGQFRLDHTGRYAVPAATREQWSRWF
ncbi:MAG: SIR2 family protein [Candidatus Nanopelagicales bacterium]